MNLKLVKLKSFTNLLLTQIAMIFIGLSLWISSGLLSSGCVSRHVKPNLKFNIEQGIELIKVASLAGDSLSSLA